jgi:hypothetical protein
MSKFKLYLIIAGVVIFFSMGATIKLFITRDKSQKADIERLESNWLNEVANKQKIVSLLVKEKELTREQRKAVDSLAKELKIKPKFIDRIVYIDIYTRDTVKVPVYVTITGKGQWNISDSSKCFKWAGIALLSKDDLKITRTLYENTNKVTDVFYKVRPHKFLCIRFGRWVYKQQISSTCGNVQERNIVFTK